MIARKWNQEEERLVKLSEEEVRNLLMIHLFAIMFPSYANKLLGIGFWSFNREGSKDTRYNEG